MEIVFIKQEIGDTWWVMGASRSVVDVTPWSKLEDTRLRHRYPPVVAIVISLFRPQVLLGKIAIIVHYSKVVELQALEKFWAGTLSRNLLGQERKAFSLHIMFCLLIKGASSQIKWSLVYFLPVTNPIVVEMCIWWFWSFLGSRSSVTWALDGERVCRDCDGRGGRR